MKNVESFIVTITEPQEGVYGKKGEARGETLVDGTTRFPVAMEQLNDQGITGYNSLTCQQSTGGLIGGFEQLLIAESTS